jgi:hypothetical protein
VDKPSTTCDHPISLLRTSVDVNTGEVGSRVFEKDCGTRLASRCAHCAEVYRRDAIEIIRAGLRTDDNRQIPFTFLTLTAPGADVFGAIHQRTVRHRRKGGEFVQRCRCGDYHAEGDAAIGTPIDDKTYRYDLAAEFNAASSRLLTVTMQKLGRIVGRKLRYVRVAEFQSRGLIHFHILVSGIITDASFHSAVRGGRNLRTGRMIHPAEHQGWSWGPQCDIKRVLPGGRIGVGAYLVKVVNYAAKSTGDSAQGVPQLGKRMEWAAGRRCKCEEGIRCRRGSRIIPGTDLVYQSQPSRRLCRKHSLARRGWGFRGHTLSISRAWGPLNFKIVRERRRTYARNASPDLSQEVTWRVLAAWEVRAGILTT